NGHRNAHCEGNDVLSESCSLRNVIFLSDLSPNLSSENFTLGEAFCSHQTRHLRRNHMAIRMNGNEETTTFKRESNTTPRGRGSRGAAKSDGLTLHFEQLLGIHFTTNLFDSMQQLTFLWRKFLQLL